MWQNTVRNGEEMNEDSRSAGSKADFLRLAGIGPELVEFVIDFMEKPEIYFSMSFERRREIENQMDAILSSFEQGVHYDSQIELIQTVLSKEVT
jgi:hypothetical protein